MRKRYATSGGIRRGLARLAVLLACVTAWPSLAAERVLPPATDQRFYEFCRYGHQDYEAVKAGLEPVFPKGAAASPLFDLLENSGGTKSPVSGEPTLGYRSGAEPEAYMHGYMYRCPIESGNVNLWQVSVIVDGTGGVDTVDFRLFFNDDNFSKRRIPFRFENFDNGSSGKRALWSLTGPGTSRQEVERIMREAGLSGRSTQVRQGGFTDQYRKYPDKESLFYRLGSFYVWVLIWEFDNEGRLRDLRVN